MIGKCFFESKQLFASAGYGDVALSCSAEMRIACSIGLGVIDGCYCTEELWEVCCKEGFAGWYRSCNLCLVSGLKIAKYEVIQGQHTTPI